MPEPGMLGKLEPRYDPRTLEARNYLLLDQLEVVPASTQWDDGITAWGMMLNGPAPENPPEAKEGLGCCTCSAMGHAIQSWTMLNGAEVTIPNSAVLTAYEDCGGYRLGDRSTDGGCIELDVLRYWRKTGIAGHKLGAFADISNPRDHQMVMAAVFLFDALYIGFNVPASALEQFRRGEDWEVVADDGGIVGGHAVVVLDYDQEGVRVVTWGQIQRMTWAFWDRYVDEAHVCFSEEWLRDGQAPNGVLRDKLLTDLAQLSSQPSPDPEPPEPTPPPWTPDPAVDADLDWIAAMVAQARTQYDAEELAPAAATLVQIGAYPGRLGMYLDANARGETPARVGRPDGK